MQICRELGRIGNKSLVEILNKESWEEKTIKYAVVRNYDERKPMGEKWSHSIGYFDIWGSYGKEEALQDAMRCFMEIKKQPILYDRLSEIATLLKDGLIDDDKESAIEYMRDTIEMSDAEAEYFGVKEMINPTTYKVVKVTMSRVVKTKIKVLMPDNEPAYNVDDYIENMSYLDDETIDDADDWEVYDTDIMDEGLTLDAVDRMYVSNEDLWNSTNDFR